MMSGAAGPGHSWLSDLGLRRSATHGRFTGKGEPLIGSSWLNRPFSFGGFVGPYFGQRLISGRIDQDNDVLAGFHTGWDFDDYWGTEFRFAWARPHLYNLQQPQLNRQLKYYSMDWRLHYYPWGDSRIRPYGLLGIGLADFRFVDDFGNRGDTTPGMMPFGVGIKYLWCRWLSFRTEFVNNLAFSKGELTTMHNLTLTFGMELRFGTKPRGYWPWHPGRHLW